MAAEPTLDAIRVPVLAACQPPSKRMPLLLAGSCLAKERKSLASYPAVALRPSWRDYDLLAAFSVGVHTLAPVSIRLLKYDRRMPKPSSVSVPLRQSNARVRQTGLAWALSQGTAIIRYVSSRGVTLADSEKIRERAKRGARASNPFG